MKSKKDDLPAMPFYTGDWFKAGDVRSLTLEQRGVWIDILCYMWESNERGYLVSGSGEPYTLSELSRMIGLPEDLLNQNLNQMESKKIFSVRESDKAIYCRRMVRDQQIREMRKKVGKLGGNPNLVKGLVGDLDNQKGNQNTENEIENEDETENKNNGIENEVAYPEGVDREKVDSDVDKLWAISFGRTPKIPEREVTIELLCKFGYDKMRMAFKKGVLNGFKNIDTLKSKINNDGELILDERSSPQNSEPRDALGNIIPTKHLKLKR